MDFGVCGLIDIILIVMMVITLIVGFTRGFMNKVVSLIGAIAVFVFATFYCKAFAGFLIGNPPFNGVYASLHDTFKSAASARIPEITSETTSTQVLAAALNIPEFFANLISLAFKNVDTTNMIESMSTIAATWIMNIIAYFIIVIGCFLVIGILKIIIHCARNASKLVKVVDGILGMVLYGAIFFVTVTALFALLRIFYDNNTIPAMNAWIDKDFAMTVTDGVMDSRQRLSKALFTQNFFVTICNYIGALFH